MRRLSAILYVVLFAAPATVLGQNVQVQALVNESTIGDQETLRYSIHIKAASLENIVTPNPPSVQGLTLLQRSPSTQRNMTIINGNLEQSVVFEWRYRPVRTGTAKLDATGVTIDGDTYTTDPITITVVPQSQRPRQPSASGRRQMPFMAPSQPPSGSDAERSVNARDLFIRAVPSKSTVRQNEQVTIEYQLFFRDGIQLRHSRLSGSWDAEGFWREEFDVDTRPVPTSVVENGLLYHMIVLKRVAVFPTRSGTLTVDPLEIETEAYFPSASGDPFERFFSLRNRFDTVELSSEAVRIDVQPLPPGAPPSFAGAVGDFQMSASISDVSIDVGEPVELEVSLRGTGNVATIDAPQIEPAGIFERYDPDVRTSINRSGDRIRGSKTFTYVLVPRSNGTFQMPPVRFSYYQPDRAEFVTLESELPSVEISGTAAPLAAGTTSEGLPVDDIAGIMTATSSWTAIADRPLHRQVWPYATLAFPVAALLLLFGYQRRAERMATDTRYARNRMAHPLAKKHLRKAETLLREKKPRAFYNEIERAVIGFAGNRLNIAELGLTRDQLDVRLDEAGMSSDDRQVLRELLEECDRARFGPILPDRTTMESAQDRAARVIVALDQAIQRSARAAA